MIRSTAARRRYSWASGSRTSASERSRPCRVAPSTNAVGVWVWGVRPGGIPDRSGGDHGRNWTVAPESATTVATRNAAHNPLIRDNCTAWPANSRISWGSAGSRVGMARSANAASEQPGTVEDFAAGSSPTMTTAPPRGSVPMRLAWRSASVARSRPGDLPYHHPVIPSQVSVAAERASWVPTIAVAASSSLTAGRWTMPNSSSRARRRISSRS